MWLMRISVESSLPSRQLKSCSRSCFASGTWISSGRPRIFRWLCQLRFSASSRSLRSSSICFPCSVSVVSCCLDCSTNSEWWMPSSVSRQPRGCELPPLSQESPVSAFSWFPPGGYVRHLCLVVLISCPVDGKCVMCPTALGESGRRVLSTALLVDQPYWVPHGHQVGSLSVVVLGNYRGVGWLWFPPLAVFIMKYPILDRALYSGVCS